MIRPDLSALRPSSPLASLARAALGLVAPRTRSRPTRARPAPQPVVAAPRLEVQPTLWR